MSKSPKFFTVRIRHTETYEYDTVVSASSRSEALRKVKQDWEESGYLYEKTIDGSSDSRTNFQVCGESSDEKQ